MKLFLFASVSALAVMTALPMVADAAGKNAPAGEWSLSVEGDYVSLNSLNLWWGVQDEAISGKLCAAGYCEYNYVNNVGPLKLHGWGGAAELDWKPAGMELDFLVRGRYSRTNKKNISETWNYGTDDGYSPSYPDGGTASYTETHTTVDFEVGHDLGIGGVDLRIFGGARYARFSGQNSFSTYQYEDDAQYADGKMKRTFTGLGPRIGFNGSMPFGDSMLGIDFGASAAALFGDRATTISFTKYELDIPKPEGSSKFVVIPNAEASAALTVKIGRASCRERV